MENQSKPYESKYDISYDHNLEQVMGTNRWLWAFPIMPASTKPRGEGIYFEKNVDSEASEGEGGEDETPEDNNQPSERRPDHSQNRPPANFQRRQPENGQGNQGSSQVVDARAAVGTVGRAQNHSLVHREEFKEGQDTVQTTKQGDKMTIHNDRTSKWDNLNNIVKAENPPQTYKSSGSDENSAAVVGSSVAGKKQFTNQIDPQAYEEMK